MSDRPRFAVIGAGLGGALMAINLGRLGYRVEVFERRADPRGGTGGEGRSINLAISTRGLHALGEAGVRDAVLAEAVSMRGRMMHAPNGRLAFQAYGTKPEHVINSVSRSGLNRLLIEAADALPNVSLCFEQTISDVDVDAPAFTTAPSGGGAPRRVEPDVLVGADGAFSVVRARMARLDRFDYSQSYLAHGYKELTIPPAAGGGFRMEPHALHIWPRGGFMMIALPNHDGSFTCTLFWPFEGPNSFAAVGGKDAVGRFFGEHFADAVPVMPALLDEFETNRVSSLVTVRCGPWYRGGQTVLLGDACHAVVPFYGQGANAAFEDCSVLAHCLEAHAPHWDRAFGEYYARRKRHVDTLADLAIGNFLEMRDRVASPTFRMKKRFDNTLYRLVPALYRPLYHLVTFTRVPYGDAVRRARRESYLLLGLLLVVVVLLGWLLWT